MKLFFLLDYSAKNFENSFLLKEIFELELRKRFKENLAKFGTRLNERSTNQIRDLKIKTDFLPDAHGSCIFSRGETEVLSVVTFGKASERKLSDDSSLSYLPKKNFIHHYNFPSFSVGELSNLKLVSRREIGHGNLVERSFSRFIPAFREFPYMTRVVSEVLSAEGSSSQASICSSSVALMNSGFPLRKHLAGIALGVFNGEILVDIDDIEDKLGGADFKISGTEDGVCSLQLDTKFPGIKVKDIINFLEKGRAARMEIIGRMKQIISEPRPRLHPSAPKFRKLYVGGSKIGLVIGQKGKVIESITLKTGVRISFNDEAYALLYHENDKNIEDACFMINGIIGNSSKI